MSSISFCFLSKEEKGRKRKKRTMPAGSGIDKCISGGGRVRTLKPNPDEYLHICYLGGKSYHGEVKKVKGPKKRSTKKGRKKGRK